MLLRILKKRGQSIPLMMGFWSAISLLSSCSFSDSTISSGTLSKPPGRCLYVAQNIANASDNNSGISMEKPFKTINGCLKHLKAGDTVWIREGVYRESVMIDVQKNKFERTIIPRCKFFKKGVKNLYFLLSANTLSEDGKPLLERVVDREDGEDPSIKWTLVETLSNGLVPLDKAENAELPSKVKVLTKTVRTWSEASIKAPRKKYQTRLVMTEWRNDNPWYPL